MTNTKKIIPLILNSPYEEPTQYWRYIVETQGFEKINARRPAGYWRASSNWQDYKNREDPGEYELFPLVNEIRRRVKAWRENDYLGVTSTTRNLLKHWHNNRQSHGPKRLFWCQVEAIETAIWITEANHTEKQGIHIPQDNTIWERQCIKLATGTGKTVVMAMLIAWQALNKIYNPQDTRFSKYILIIVPGITIRDRLQVLLPSSEHNIYEEFNLLDSETFQKLSQAKIKITNWHILAPAIDDNTARVVHKGPESDRAFVRRILGDGGRVKRVLVINDEGHHCHRPFPSKNNTKTKKSQEQKQEEEKATIWIQGIDRIHRACGVLKAYDLTATPFKPTGKNNRTEQLFSWIISDFGLNDSLESGLVKTPRIAIRDDAVPDKNLRSKFFHLHEHVRQDLKRSGGEHHALPDLVNSAITILSGEWERIRQDWQEEWKKTKEEREKSNEKVPPFIPPVMIIISDRIQTAKRLEYQLKEGNSISCLPDELKYKILRIDKDALEKLEKGEELSSKKDWHLKKREELNTVGKEGQAGEQVRCVLGVNMLSEGWDARNVKQILGLRAFTSQLLCEQVIGRGLRRMSYELNEETELFNPEYVTVFGVPFTFLPLEENSSDETVAEKPKVKIESLKEREHLKIEWPHVLRVQYKLNYFLDIDWDKLPSLILTPENTPTLVENAALSDSHTYIATMKKIAYDSVEELRFQQLKLKIAAQLLHELEQKNRWKGHKGEGIQSFMRLIEIFLSHKVILKTAPDEQSKKQLLVTNRQRIINHLQGYLILKENTEPEAIFDTLHPKRSTSDVKYWYTTKNKVQPIYKSQLSHIIADSKGEGDIAFELERERIKDVLAWVKNDSRIKFEIYYLWQGGVHSYYPDFIIKRRDNKYLILELKGNRLKEEQDKEKWKAAEEWVEAVNRNGNFGTWTFKVLYDPKDIWEVMTCCDNDTTPREYTPQDK